MLEVVQLPRARDFATRFPDAGFVPELQVDEPAIAFIFADGASVIGSRRVGTRGEAVHNGVVCVVVDAVPHVYLDVPRPT